MEEHLPSGTEELFAGRYQGLREIGAGGMARIYRAEDVVLGRPVALKVLFEEFARDATFLQRLQQEARAAAQLSHPNIVTIYDVGADRGQHFLVMEYVEGRNLKEVLQAQGPLPLDRAVAIGIQVCAGLEFAHRRGIVHRDIKPQNLLVSEGETPLLPPGNEITMAAPLVKITDFGIARALGTASLSKTGQVLGTVHYLSPEQARGDPAGPQSDVYAVGVVLYELLTGTVPFDGETPVSIAYQHLYEPPVPPRQRHPSIPPWLEAVILRALAKAPEDRFSSAAELGRALAEGARQSLDRTVVHAVLTPPEPSPPPPRGATVRPAAKRKSHGILVALVVFTLLWAVGGLFLFATIFSRPASGGNAPSGPATGPGGGAPVRVPEVVGLEVAQAQQRLTELGLRYVEVGRQFSTSVPEGAVLSQDPPPGSAVSPGTMVSVVVSQGKGTGGEMVEVPNVVGLLYAVAKDRLAFLGLSVASKEAWHETVAEGAVFAQEPRPGERIPRGSGVLLTVSRGKEKVPVPNVVGKPEGEAQRLIQEARLRNFPWVNYQGHDTLPDALLRQVCVGCVLSVTPKEGTIVEVGTEIKMAVRKD